MASTDTRVVMVMGLEFTFQRHAPEIKGPPRAGLRKVVGEWVTPIGSDESWTTGTVNELIEGTFEPSSLPGVAMDFPGAAAVEVTIRLLHHGTQRQANKARRQRDLLLGGMAVLAMAALAAFLR